MNVYFISGLGADKKAFERLRLPDKFSLHYLDWISPHKTESLNDYAKRLAQAIDTSQPFALVGLSMGGMIAAAMTAFLQPQKTILISSIGCNAEFPPLLKIARATRVYKLIPQAFFHHPNRVANWIFGAKSRSEKTLLHYLISNADPRFIKWAFGAILNWKDCVRPKKLFHIHGERDKILPLKYTKPDVVIEKGSHFIVWTKAGQVSKLIEQALA